MWICPKCNNSDIHQKAWVLINTDNHISSFIDFGDDEEYWCGVCEIHIRPIQDDSSTTKE